MRNEVALPGNERLIPRWMLIGLFALVSVAMGLFAAYGRFNIDEGMHLNAGRLLFERGLWPYRDFPFSQASAAPLLYGATSALFGTSLLVGRSLSVLLSLAGVAAMAWFAHRIEGRVAAVLVLLLVIGNFPALWTFTQIRTEAPSIALTLLATIAWLSRKGFGEPPSDAGVLRWALAPCLLVWATAFRLTYAVPLLAMCGLVVWELRRSPRLLGWTAAVVGLNGFIAALPMLAFWQESFFHILESQWSRAERFHWDPVPLSKRIWFFGRLESGFHAILLLSIVPLFELRRRVRSGWRPWLSAESSEKANSMPTGQTGRADSTIAFLLAMAALTYLPLLVFKVGFFQYFVNASLLLSLAIGISLPIVARRSDRHRLALCVAFAAVWTANAAVSIATAETWVSTGTPPVRQLAELRSEIEQLTPNGCTMMTFETHFAVETGCDVTPGLEYSYFSFFPELPGPEATAHHVLNRRMLHRSIRRDRPEYVALTWEGVKRITGREPDMDQPPTLVSLGDDYRLLHKLRLPVGPIHTFWTEVHLYARRDL